MSLRLNTKRRFSRQDTATANRVSPEATAPVAGDFPGWRTLLLVTLLYVFAIAVATYPSVLHLSDGLPHVVDPLVHLWTMRWYQTCLHEGRPPFLCPELQYPIGAPLGYLPPMHIQSLGYLLLSPVLNNDALVYNLLWWTALVTTGLGTFALAWYLLRERWSAAFAGLIAMLSGPMLYWGHEQLEQITLAGLPLFLLAWIRFVDRPRPGRLIGALMGYGLLTAGAPYFAIMGIFPAVLYVFASYLRRESSRRVWFRERIGPFAAFAGLSLLMLGVLFSTQVWAVRHGFCMTRPTSEFNQFAASFWGYIFPNPPHLLCQVLPAFHEASGMTLRVPSYLGAVTIGLLAYGMFHRVRFAKAGYWWTTLCVLVLLSLGAYWNVGGYQVALPAHWLKEYVPLFQPLRVPARFNLFAAMCAAIIAGASLREILVRMTSPLARSGAACGFIALAVLDLASVPFAKYEPIPPLPACYKVVHERAPDGAFFEAPQFNAGWRLPAACTYWQALHQGRTSAGYTAYFNPKLESLLFHTSPFSASRLADPTYLANPESERYDLVPNVAFLDQAWLYLNVHGFDHLIVHHRPGSYPELPIHLDRMEALLEDAKIISDEEAAVYATSMLKAPDRPMVLCTEGWRQRWPFRGRYCAAVMKTAEIVLYTPRADRAVTLNLSATAFRKARQVRLMDDRRVLASWTIEAGEPTSLRSPPLRLSKGLHRLKLVSDGENDPPRHHPVFEVDPVPISLLAYSVSVAEAPED